jgi:hypothetical protein
VWPELRHLPPETVEALAALERCAAESALEAAGARSTTAPGIRPSNCAE